MTLLLVCHGHPTMRRYQHPNLGRLVQPRHYSSIEATSEEGFPWAADNDAFNGGFDADAFGRMLDRLDGLGGCRFVAVPDVVGDAPATLDLFAEWGRRLRSRFPVALVGQDGLEHERVPWGDLDAFFIGGSTTWKLGEAAATLTREAKRRGKWAHMGRVNSRRRVHYARSIGCDSVDGTSFARYPSRWIPAGLEWCSEPLSGQLRMAVDSHIRPDQDDSVQEAA